MMLKKIVVLLLLATAFVGCEDKRPGPSESEATKPEVYGAEGNAYMKDPEFKKQCEASVRLRGNLLAERQKIVERRKAILDKYAGDETKAAEDPEWAKVAADLKIADRKLVDRQEAAMDLVRHRMRQAAEDSKRIANGSAVPKK